MAFEILCMATVALLFGLVLVFGGYRLFLLILPIWGFFAGFVLGAQTIDYLFDVGLFATVTGWVVGFFVGLIFAVLSYLFYLFAVGVVSFSLGYGATIGILAWIGLDPGFLLWLIAVVVGTALVFVVYRFNLQKYAIIVATAVGGTGVIIYTLLVLFNGAIAVSLLQNPIKLAIDNSFWWLLFFLVVAGLGIAAQIQANRTFEADAYNRLAEVS
ncbi:MAG: TM7S3/TM198-like domain-containing protein [Candidatus Promineifilaceae bacterium]